MQNITRIALGLGAAAVVASGGSAFTAANSSEATGILGYNTVDISGVTVTNIAYNHVPADTSMLDTIVFTVTENVSNPLNHKVTLTMGGSTTTKIACDTRTATTLTCDVNVTVASVDDIQLNVSTI